MKKMLTILLLLSVLFVTTLVGCTTEAQEAGQSEPGPTSPESAGSEISASGLSAFGITRVNDVYHQLCAIVVDYGSTVEAPEPWAYSVVDFGTSGLRDKYDDRESSEATVSAVYTNSAPELREDKNSVEGQYMIIELAPTNAVIYEDGMYKPHEIAVQATWRLDGETCEWERDDYSGLVITQRIDIAAPDGSVVAAAGVLPELKADELKRTTVDEFQQLSLTSANGKYEVHYNLYVPENYDASKTYPMVINVSGTGGRLNYEQQDAAGNLLCLGSNVSRDRAAVVWAEADEDVIVLSPQPWMNEPEEWECDIISDSLLVIDATMESLSVDENRIYAIGSSFGTMHLSQIIGERPELLAAYIMCNGTWVGEERNGSTFINAYNEEFGGFLSGKDLEYLESIPDSARLSDAEIVEWVRPYMQGMADNEIPIWIWHAVNDGTIAVTTAMTVERALTLLYEEKGLSQERIDELILTSYLEDEAFLAYGNVKQHACSKVTVADPEVISWTLAQSKSS